jgi:hypothetical protein
MLMGSSHLATALAHAAGELNASLTRVDTEAKKDPLARCAVCGNDCADPMEVHFQGRVAIFDCFECAIHSMAITCERCRCRIIGHGVESAGRIYCSSHCAHVAQAR